MRNNNFDILRLVLSIMVLVFHLGVLTNDSFLKKFPGELAVEFFFVISGFLISKSYLNSNCVKYYFKSRFLRIYPLYFLCVMLCFLIGMVLYPGGINAYLFDGALKYLIANLTLLNFIHPNIPGLFLDNINAGVVNGSLWTIKVEVMFYITVPIIFGAVGRFIGNKNSVLLVGVFSLVSSALVNIIVDKYDLNESLKNQLPSLMIFFMVGAAINFYNPRFLTWKYLPFLSAFLYFSDGYALGKTFHPFVISALVYIFAFKIKPVKVHENIGDISYGIYIFHFPVIQFMIQFGMFENYIFGFFSVIVTVFFLSFLSWHLMEKRLTVRSKSR